MELLIKEIEKLTNYLVKNRRVREEQLEKFYEACYQVLCKGRKRYSSLNTDLVNEFLKEDIAKVNLLFHDMVFK